MLDSIDKIVRGISKVVLAVLIILGFAMLGISWAHIFYRYVLNNSLSWSEELLKILVVWFCLLSASFISARREHVRITVFKQLLPKPLEKAADFAVSFLMFFVAAVMCYIGIRLVGWAGKRSTPVLRVPFSYTYAAIYISFGIIAVYELRNFIADIISPGVKPALTESNPSLDEMVQQADEQEKLLAGQNA